MSVSYCNIIQQGPAVTRESRPYCLYPKAIPILQQTASWNWWLED